ncbi:MAG: carbohydrate ABC transporter permease [Gemmatimonadota bacterium]|nr:carbohydrate ABC transporter permease [Gemmatimonadota bacterium]
MKRLGTILLHIALILATVFALAPMLWMVSASFMPTGTANAYPPPLIPRHPTLEHYRTLFGQLAIGRYMLNSAIIASAATLLSLLVNSLAGYAIAKLRFRGRDTVHKVMGAALLVPVQVTMLPLFLLLKQLGLVNSYWGAIIPSVATIFGIFLIRQYALGIPDDLLDAARIDGASEFRIYWSIVLPVIRPILATLAIWTFLASWNDFLWPLVVLTDDARYTLPVALASLSGEHVQDTELMMAGAVVTVFPVVVVFLMLQRAYVQGVMVGSVKG